MPQPPFFDPQTLREQADQLDQQADAYQAKVEAWKVAHPAHATDRLAHQLTQTLPDSTEHARTTASSFRQAATMLGALERRLGCDLDHENYVIFQSARPEHLQECSHWSGHAPLPSIGQRVQVSMNGLGSGTVTGYFFAGIPGEADRERPEVRYLGLAVQLDDPPSDYRQQHPDWKTSPALIFGNDLEGAQ